MKKKHKLVFGPLALGLCAVPTYEGLAAFDAFIKIDGVPGESSDAKHKDEIEVLSYSWGMAQSGGLLSGWNLKCNKAIDKSSPYLYVCSAGGSNLTSGTLSLRYPGGTNQVEYLTIKMENLIITSVQGGGAATDTAYRPQESITFNFQKIEWTYQPVTTDGAPSGPPIVTSWSTPTMPTGAASSDTTEVSPK